MHKPMQARFIRSGDLIEGVEVLSSDHFITAFIGRTVEVRMADGTKHTWHADHVVNVFPASASA